MVRTTADYMGMLATAINGTPSIVFASSITSEYRTALSLIYDTAPNKDYERLIIK